MPESEPIPTDETEVTRDQVVDAIRRAAMDGDVRQMVLKVQLAAEIYPEAIRAALAHVFDLSAIEGWATAVSTSANHAQLKLAELAEMKSWLEVSAGPAIERALELGADVEALRRENAALKTELAALKGQVTKAFDYLRDVVRKLQSRGLLATRAAQPQKGNHVKGNVHRPAAGEPGASQA